MVILLGMSHNGTHIDRPRFEVAHFDGLDWSRTWLVGQWFKNWLVQVQNGSGIYGPGSKWSRYWMVYVQNGTRAVISPGSEACFLLAKVQKGHPGSWTWPFYWLFNCLWPWNCSWLLRVQYDPGRDWRGSKWFRSLGEDEDTISFWSLDPAFDLDNGPHLSRFRIVQALIGQGSDHDCSRFTRFSLVMV
jgi:hypothetical protein